MLLVTTTVATNLVLRIYGKKVSPRNPLERIEPRHRVCYWGDVQPTPSVPSCPVRILLLRSHKRQARTLVCTADNEKSKSNATVRFQMDLRVISAAHFVRAYRSE
jgi:hypothetical protein